VGCLKVAQIYTGSPLGLRHILKESTSEGHCYLPTDVLLEKSKFLLTTSEHILSESKLRSILMKLLNSEILRAGGLSESVYLPPFYRAEVTVAGLVRSMATTVGAVSTSRIWSKITEIEDWLYGGATTSRNKEDSPYLNSLLAAEDVGVVEGCPLYYRNDLGAERSDKSLGLNQDLSEEQLAALALFELNQIAIITGGPGTGKTFTLQTLMRRLSGTDVALVAPTGKAAKRLANVTGHEAKTIHRLLEWSVASCRFSRNQSNPLKEKFVVVDEASMVDLFLFNSLLKALPPLGKLLLVGDQDQLPSVGPGMVLRDLIHSELVPITKLTLIRRQQNDSDIITAAHQINQGITPKLQTVNNPFSFNSRSSDCLWLDAESPEQVAQEIVLTLSSLKTSGFNLRSSVQVLSPMKKGAAGTKNLNVLLQQYINPRYFAANELQIGDEIWRVGDRVIQTRNDYSTGVMNGESGEIVAVDKEEKKSPLSLREVCLRPILLLLLVTSYILML